MPVLTHPGIEVPEGLGTKRINTLLSFGTHMHKSHLLQDPQMAGYARLVDIDALHDFVDRLLAALEDFENSKSRGVSESLEGRYVHFYVYVRRRIYSVKPKLQRRANDLYGESVWQICAANQRSLIIRESRKTRLRRDHRARDAQPALQQGSDKSRAAITGRVANSGPRHFEIAGPCRMGGNP
jgi:hypothetical protein